MSQIIALFAVCKQIKTNSMKRLTRIFGVLLLMMVVVAACSKDSFEPSPSPSPSGGGGGTTPTPTPTPSDEIQKATDFAYDALDTYYLWKDKIKNAMETELDTYKCTDPIAAVNKIRYKEGGGYASKQDEDRWTQLYDDISPFQESVQGVNTTNGMSLTVGKFTNSDPQAYFFIVNFTYENSPAAKSGIKRGDVIIDYNGEDITDENLEDAYYGTTTATYGLADWKADGIHDRNESVTLSSVKMYCDPVICSKIFDVNGKKVGYLMYDNFDVESVDKLVKLGKDFKSAGVKELIIDLRYNGGGYVFTEEVLASIFAPKASVDAKNLYMTEIYNDVLTNAFGKSDKNFNKTYLSYEHEFGSKGDDVYKKISTKDANIGLEKIYAIVTGNTASASESLLVGLNPFMNGMVTIGQQSYGKYCTGYILGVDDVYNSAPAAISKWGIYVMVSTYADRDGKNMARPVGIVPDKSAKDTPWDGYDIGDENETMLKEALKAAGKSYANTRSVEFLPQVNVKPMHNKYRFAKRIMQAPKVEKMK